MHVHNITLREWTNYVDDIDQRSRLANGSVDITDTRYKNMRFRLPESNDCEIFESSVTEYPQEVSYSKNTQTFSVKYKKPFKSSEL